MIANLSAALIARGGKAMILTARWESTWPPEITHRGVRVVRLPHPPQRIWGTLRYMREISRWLGDHRDQFDLAYVSQLKHDAYVAVRTGRKQKFPVVLRATGGGELGDCHWHAIGRCGMRIRRETRRATAIVAPSPAIRDELLAAGFPSSAVVLFAVSGVPIEALRPALPDDNKPDRRSPPPTRRCRSAGRRVWPFTRAGCTKARD